MNIITFYGVPVVFALIAAFFARRQVRWAERVGLAAMLVVPAIIAWYGCIYAAYGTGLAVSGAVWSAVWSSPAWSVALLIGTIILRKKA